LIADAPEEALDERMIRQRDRSYLIAYRWMALFAFGVASALMAYAIFTDFQTDSDGFNYDLSLTWPQVQAIFWLIFGYSFMLPSMAMISLERKKGSRNR
jgi:hypothetical protein